MKKLNRRTMLRGMLAGSVVTVSLPLLDVFLNENGTALASGESIPPRFGMFFWGNGVIPKLWVPRGEGADWELSELMMPLSPVKDELTVLSGFEVKTPNMIPHHSGAAGLLSGSALIVDGEESRTFAGPSIDQFIASEIGLETRFRSLEFGAEVKNGYSYNGPNNQNPFENSPFTLFERIFGAGFRVPGEEVMVDPSIGLRRSVLDVLVKDVEDVNKGLGVADRAKMEQHLEGIRALELRLARLEEDPPNRAACMRPETMPEASYPEIEGRPQIAAKNRAMCDLVAMALACDQTRVFTNQITQPVTNILFEGASAGHHQLTHDEPGDQPQVAGIVKVLMSEFVYMLEAMRAIPEGDGTLLDNSIVLGTSDVSFGRTHSLDDFPIVLAGQAGGRLKKGIHYRSTTKENTSTIMLTLARAVGVRAASFGQKQGEAKSTLGAIEM